MFSINRRVVATTASVGVGVVAAGAAWAAWNLTGSGSAQAKAGTVENLTVTSAGLPSGGLTPGNPTSVLLNVENKNKLPVKVVSIFLSQLQSQGDCDASTNVDIINTAPLPADASLTIPAATA